MMRCLEGYIKDVSAKSFLGQIFAQICKNLSVFLVQWWGHHLGVLTKAGARGKFIPVNTG